MTTNRQQTKRIRLAEAAQILGCSVATIRVNNFGFRLYKLTPTKTNSPLMVDRAEVTDYARRQAVN